MASDAMAEVAETAAEAAAEPAADAADAAAEMVDAAVETAVEETTPGSKRWRGMARRPRQGPPQSGAAGGGGAVYALGLIGALVYFLRSAQTREDYALAVPKAVVWPALLVYKLLKSFYG
jgi:hypothetical protein